MRVSLKKKSLRIRGKIFDLSEPRVMGIVNYTPDSFFDGGRHKSPGDVISTVAGMVKDGADIVDIGAVSTRPGAKPVNSDEEKRRLSEVLPLLRETFPELIISVDTFRTDVAELAVREFGADIINDISSGDMDRKMPETVAKLQVPCIAMHMQGTPLTMQNDPQYTDVVNDIINYFAAKISIMRKLGVCDIIVDPGFGFGKTPEHNYEIIRRLEDFGILELPLLVGFSRKSMIWKTIGSSPEDALAGTVALNTVALMKGADIIRVHDVREAGDTIKIINRVRHKISDII